jgi:hypothetical protein
VSALFHIFYHFQNHLLVSSIFLYINSIAFFVFFLMKNILLLLILKKLYKCIELHFIDKFLFYIKFYDK